MIADFGSSIPFWDQWSAEGGMIIKPFLLGKLSWTDFFVPNNEHRIVLTRLLAFGLFRADGMWDPRLEMTVNAMIAAATASLIVYLFLREMGNGWSRLIIPVVAILWMLPYGWENTLWGFQSQFYFLLLFSFTALWGLSPGPNFTARWWVGIASVVLACLSMGSGLLVGVTLIVIRCAAVVVDREKWRTHLPTLIGCLACAGISMLFVTKTTATEGFHAQGEQDFFLSLFRSLSWPTFRLSFVLLLVAIVIFQIPLWACTRTVLQRKSGSRMSWLVLSLAVWCALQAAVIAYARGGLRQLPPSKYQDVLAIGFLASFIALLLEWSRINRWLRCAWVLFAMVGLIQITAHDHHKRLPLIRRQVAEREQRCRAYVQSHDAAVLHGVTDPLYIPYPDADGLAWWLDDPQLRTTFLFVPGQEEWARWPTHSANFLLKHSRIIFAIGVVGLIALLLPTWKRENFFSE